MNKTVKIEFRVSQDYKSRLTAIASGREQCLTDLIREAIRLQFPQIHDPDVVTKPVHESEPALVMTNP